MIDTTKLNKIVINVVNDNITKELEYSLIDYDITPGENSYRVIIIAPESIDEISNIEAVNFIKEYDSSDTFLRSLTKYGIIQDITIGKPGVYRDMENNPIKTVKIIFAVRNINDAINRIEEKVFPTVNIDNMNDEEYRAYLLKEIGAACRHTIISGVDLMVGEEPNRTLQHFSLTEDDQRNISSLASIAMSTRVSLPYHADGTQCVVYSYKDIIRLYGKAQAHILYHTTYCNSLNTYIRSLSTKSEMMGITYGMTIPNEDIVDAMNVAIAQGQAVITAVLDQYGLTIDDEPVDNT